mmetsp:Transcript_78393/g.91613  ORF Transcript_78393/g.91613 Transcript_78393/m.91613 type:complete len:206 (-) Transcript_78393:618-1235(-)
MKLVTLITSFTSRSSISEVETSLFLVICRVSILDILATLVPTKPPQQPPRQLPLLLEQTEPQQTRLLPLLPVLMVQLLPTRLQLTVLPPRPVTRPQLLVRTPLVAIRLQMLQRMQPTSLQAATSPLPTRPQLLTPPIRLQMSQLPLLATRLPPLATLPTPLLSISPQLLARTPLLAIRPQMLQLMQPTSLQAATSPLPTRPPLPT